MYEYAAVITRWVDGDTFDANVDMGMRIYSAARFRLYGCDTPERGEAGYKEAAAFASALTIGKAIFVRTYKDPDKYGRWLAQVRLDNGSDLTAAMIEAGLAKPYFGGSRAPG